MKKTILEVSRKIKNNAKKIAEVSAFLYKNSILPEKVDTLYIYYINKVKPLMTNKKVKVGSIISYDNSDMTWQDIEEEVSLGMVIKIYKKALFDSGGMIDWADIKWLSTGGTRSFVLYQMLNDERLELVSY